MKTVILLAFLSLCAPLGANEEPEVNKTWVNVGGRILTYHNSPRTFPDAEQACRSAGGHLASVHSNNDNHSILGLIMKNNATQTRAWLGGFQFYGTSEFYWTDGSTWDYQNWRPGEPNNVDGVEHCVEMNYFSTDGKWNDHRCEIKKPFVCARRA